MLVQLLGYEFYKKWKVLRYILGGFIVLQALLLTITRVFFWNNAKTSYINMEQNSGNFSIGFTLFLYSIIAIVMFLIPFFESIYRFEKDLSGKQAVLELMIPIISWKKILSKLIVTLCTTIVFQMIAAFSVMVYVLVISNFKKEIVDLILNNARTILSSPAKSSFVALSMLFAWASLYMLVIFCIAFSKSISHKNRIAVPIGIGMFIVCLVVSIVTVIQIGRFPIVKFDLFGVKYSLSEMIFDILFFVLPFLGTSFLMEKRIEN